MINIHTIFQHSHIEEHLHPIVFFGFYSSFQCIFISLSGFHFNKSTHITLHIVQTTLNAQRLTNIRRFQNRIRLIQCIARLLECLLYRFLNMFKMHLAIIEERLFLVRHQQIFASSQLYGILSKSLLHASDIIRILNICMNPFIQKQIGNITQQQRSRIVYWNQTIHKIIGRVATIFLITFGQ